MKNYRFVSTLSQREILSRIRTHAVPAQHFGWQFEGNKLFYRIENDNSFMLIKTGSMGRGGGQTPFFGKIYCEENRSIIEGRFRPEKKIFRFLIPLWAIPVVIAAALQPSLLPVFLPFWILWVCSCVGLFCTAAPRLWRTARTDVLSFIESTLLR